MPATAVTIASLFGSDSKVQFVGETELDDKMEFSFSGFSSEFVTGMGGRGKVHRIVGLLRSTSQVSRALAATNFNSLLSNGSANGINDFKNAATVLTFASDTSDGAILVGVASLTNVVIMNFELTENRKFSRDGSSIRVSAPFTMELRKLI